MSCQSPEVFPRKAVLYIVGIYSFIFIFFFAGRFMVLIAISSSVLGSSWVYFSHVTHPLACSLLVVSQLISFSILLSLKLFLPEQGDLALL